MLVLHVHPFPAPTLLPDSAIFQVLKDGKDDPRLVMEVTKKDGCKARLKIVQARRPGVSCSRIISHLEDGLEVLAVSPEAGFGFQRVLGDWDEAHCTMAPSSPVHPEPVYLCISFIAVPLRPTQTASKAPSFCSTL